MKISRLFILPLLLACSPPLPAADTATKGSLPVEQSKGGKPQQLSSPDQVPEGLAKSDWSSIRAAYEAGRHAFQPIDGGWQARNPGQQWTTKFDHRGFLTQPREGAWQWGLELKSYGFGNEQQSIGGTPAVKAEGQRLSYQWDTSVQEWFVNDHRGLEHGFTIAKRPTGSPGSATSTLNFLLATRGTLHPSIAADTQGVLFKDDAGATVLNYTGLKVWDADGKILHSRFEAAGETNVRLLVEEHGARYPLTIDPIAQQAYLKSGNNGGTTQDQFGYSVSVSGETVVVGAPYECSNTTGVDGASNESAGDSGAAYVFTRNGTTWSQQAYLKASNTGIGDNFGYSVAVSGDTLVVGAISEDSGSIGVNSTPNESASGSGAAYVFIRSGTTWSQQAYLKAGNAGIGDTFGNSVAVSGDTVTVGSPSEGSNTTGINSTPNESGGNAGAAYVFARNGTAWTQQAYLKASNTGANDFLGSSVAISGDTVIVGAFGEDSSSIGVNSTSNESATNSGAVYVFYRSGTTWGQQAYVKASNSGANDLFGVSVAVSGDSLVVGATGEASSTTGVNSTPTESASNSGAAYVFTRSGTTWNQQAYLKASNTGASDQFGRSVAVGGDTVVVGAYAEDSGTSGVNSTPNESAVDSGAAYVFTRSGTTWSQQAYIKASNSGTNDLFGCSVSVSLETVIVGAYREDTSNTGVNSIPNESATDSGAGYIYIRSGATWSQQAYLKASNTPGGPGAYDNFGVSVAAAGDTVVIGAYAEDSSTTGVNSTPNEGATDSGAAYVFVRSGTTWSQQAYLKASNTGANDNFGLSVAISGNTVVVGAQSEDSSTTGVNSTANESASDSGAVYVFVRNGSTWSQQAYLKAANTGANDYFGTAVGAAGDTVVVGAVFEDSSSTGVNSPSNESAVDSGATYIFIRNGTTWSQQAYLKASNTGADDRFGAAVAATGDNVVVGAIFEDSSTTGVNSTSNNSTTNSGASYIFTRSGTTWSQQAYLKPSNTGANDNFDSAVGMAGDTVIISAPVEDSSTTGINSIANESATDSGAAYIFIRNGTTWSQQAYLKASNTGVTDYFGRAVAAAGDTVVVGALFEDSNTMGANSAPNDSAPDSGAAYVFTRTGTIWSQQAYLKSSNTGANDYFGKSVTVSGDMVVIGADGEDSTTTGVNSMPDESGYNSGAAYLFTGLGPAPTISGTSPSIGSTAGGTSVTITGTNFIGATAVTVGGTPVASFTVNSATSITATTSPHAVGTTDVSVTTSTGTATGTNLFTYAAPDIAVAQAGALSDGVSSVGFGTVMVGGTYSLTFTITNPGTVDLSSLAVTKDGTNATDFIVSALSGTSIPAGSGTVTFSVTFTPSSNGAKSAAIHVASSVSGSKNPFDIALSGTGNTQPTFSGYTMSTPYETAATISLGKLLSAAADADGDTLSVSAAGPAATQGGTAQLQAGSIFYTPPNGFSGSDTFQVTVTDSRGGSVTGTVTVAVQPDTGIGTNSPALTMLSGGRMGIDFYGIPGRSYEIQRSTNLTTWALLTTITAGTNGAVSYIDESPPPGSAFYRLRKP